MHWVKLFSSAEEAGARLEENKPFTIAIDALKVCLLKNKSGLFAFKAFCPHAGASLSDAFCNPQNEIVCPLHGYRFELRSGRETSGHPQELMLYPIEVKADGVFLGIH